MNLPLQKWRLRVKSTNVNIVIPSEIMLTLRESNEELALDMKRWSALKLFSDRKLSIGQSAEFAEMSEEEFVKYLGENNITIFPYKNYDDLLEDVNNA